jgi:hypothetical protein
MSTQNRIRSSSIVGMAAAGLWIIALFIEYRYGLQPPGNGGLLYFADQIMFFIAQAGYLIMLMGLWKSKAAGDGLLGKIALGTFLAGLVSLLVAQIVQWLTQNPDFFLFPVGGLLQLIGGLLTGIALVAAKRWAGWQRYALLLQSLYYLIILFLPIAIANQSPTQLTESLWQVTWFISSLALFTRSGNTDA